jgi:hypothetical protein
METKGVAIIWRLYFLQTVYVKNGVFWDVRATRRNIPEDTILHTHHHENLKSYMCMLTFIRHVKETSRKYTIFEPSVGQ